MSNSIPPTDLVLAALHAIRNSLERLEVSHQATNARLDETNARLDNLRVQTMQKFSDLTLKVDEGFAKQGAALDRNTAELHQLTDRFDHFLSGPGSQLVQRMEKVEAEVARIAAKVDH
jgi:uncharacterized protein YaaN involved in tellurite resistance